MITSTENSTPDSTPATEAAEIPRGYWKKADGTLVPEKAVKPIDRERTKLVEGVADKALKLQAAIAEYKAAVMADIDAFVARAAEVHDVKIGRVKGNMTLPTFDGSKRVLVQVQDTIDFDERLQLAKAKIDEVIHRWSKGSRAEIKVLVQSAFEVDSKGAINARKVLELRKHAFEDAEWQEAMTLIADSVTRTFAKRYMRVQVRQPSGAYETVALDPAAF